jgi:hypothetical protein
MTYLAGYGLDHHSRAIIEVLPFCIEKSLPSLVPYLDSRLTQTEKMKKINKGCIREDSLGITEMSLWFGEEEYNYKLMK